MKIAMIAGVISVVFCAGSYGGSPTRADRLEHRVPVAGTALRSHVHTNWCVHHFSGEIGRDAIARGVPDSVVNEVEPNDAPGSGQLLSFGTGAGVDDAIDITGSLDVPTDEDEFRITLRKGDIFGIAVNRDGENFLDSILTISDEKGGLIHENDDGYSYFYIPPESPMPRIQHDIVESMTQFVAPWDGEFRVRVRVWAQNPGSEGDYVMSFRVFRHDLESQEPAKKQIIFVDFDGETINAEAIFGSGNTNAVLSPMSSFLSAWGLPNAFESAVVTEVMAVLQARFSEMAGYNENFDFELRNSRDHADPFGQENVSRLIVGGTIPESGINTIGIAEWIDPGNFSRDDTAIILLDVLSNSSLAIQDIPREPGFSLPQAIGRVVGNICAHEAGHYLGCWHTENDNFVPNIMDQGGGNSFVLSIPGLGPDGIMGSADDNPTEFRDDLYESEGIAFGVEFADQRVATALSTLAVGGCDGDANGDGAVDVNDISYVLFRIGNTGVPGTVDGDANGDGTVDVNDISYVLFRLGAC